VGLALADEVAHARGGHEHLGGTAASVAVGGRDQLLGDDPLEGDGELDADLLLLGGREDVDHAIDRLGGILGVQGGEDQVAGLRGGQRSRDRLQVTHLPDQDHVRVLAQRGLQGSSEGGGVGAQLALVDQAALVLVEELDGVLDGHDVLFALLVDQVDERGQGGRLARARGPGEQDESPRLAREVGDDGRKAEPVEGDDAVGDEAEGCAERRAREVGVDPEAGAAGHRVGEVQLPIVLQPLALVVGEDRVDHLARGQGGQHGIALDG